MLYHDNKDNAICNEYCSEYYSEMYIGTMTPIYEPKQSNSKWNRKSFLIGTNFFIPL